VGRGGKRREEKRRVRGSLGGRKRISRSSSRNEQYFSTSISLLQSNSHSSDGFRVGKGGWEERRRERRMILRGEGRGGEDGWRRREREDERMRGGGGRG
jgi:hypothetical protein